ncbi:hypothetical protein HMPREF1548_05393 [Clostridium sp. KLE 1755]|nr:hypothetical protein HMPREF1548_05393 [Clostridium sp. KLE 1755]
MQCLFEAGGCRFKKGLLPWTQIWIICPGRKLFVFLRENGILPERGWFFFKKWE